MIEFVIHSSNLIFFIMTVASAFIPLFRLFKKFLCIKLLSIISKGTKLTVIPSIFFMFLSFAWIILFIFSWPSSLEYSAKYFCKISCFAFSCSNSRTFLYRILFNSSGLSITLLISDILNPNLLYRAICFSISISYSEKSLYPFSRIFGI